MTLPTSRNTTYTPASQIKANDLNSIQDAIIGAKHPSLTIQIAGVSFQPQGGTGVSYDCSGTVAGLTMANVVRAYAPVNLPVGTRITAARLYVVDVAGTTIFGRLAESDLVNPAVGGLVSGDTPNSAGSGAYQALTVDAALFPVAVAAHRAWTFAVLTAGGVGSCTIYGAEVDYDRL